MTPRQSPAGRAAAFPAGFNARPLRHTLTLKGKKTCREGMNAS